MLVPWRLIHRCKSPQTQIFHPEIETKQHGEPEGKPSKICWGFFFPTQKQEQVSWFHLVLGSRATHISTTAKGRFYFPVVIGAL